MLLAGIVYMYTVYWERNIDTACISSLITESKVHIFSINVYCIIYFYIVGNAP